MRRVSKPPTGIAATFIVHKFYTVMNDNEQKELSYHRVQQMIQDQIDRIEHETGEKTAGIKTQEETHHQKHTVSIVAIIKRLLKMGCLHSRKRRQASVPND